jgi:hypothetical protein
VVKGSKTKKELLFVNKKKQKNFIHFGSGVVSAPREAEQKFLRSFFQKATACFLKHITAPWRARPQPCAPARPIHAMHGARASRPAAG